MKQREWPFITCKWFTKWDLLVRSSQNTSHSVKEKYIRLHINITKAFPFSPFFPPIFTSFQLKSVFLLGVCSHSWSAGVTWTSDLVWVPLPSLSYTRHTVSTMDFVKIVIINAGSLSSSGPTQWPVLDRLIWLNLPKELLLLLEEKFLHQHR